MFESIKMRWHQPQLALCLALLLSLSLVGAERALAQTPGSSQADRERAMQLFEQSKFAEALPLLEKLAVAYPSDPVVFERLGWATIVVARSIQDPQQRQQARERAKQAFLRSKELGSNSELLRLGLESVSGPDPASFSFSSNKEADDAMREGEEAHSRGELDKAIAAYQRALRLDPKLYSAALFTGDMYFKKGYQERDPLIKDEQMAKAAEWFAKAIAIDPNIETAHRYWGDALMALGKMKEARDKFVDAIIAEPYNRRAYVGLIQWAKQNDTPIGHPKIEQPPPSVKSSSGQGQTTITMDPKALDPQQGPAHYWSFYDLTRATYPTASFAKDYPKETAYRHSLKEEATALTIVAEVASKDIKSGKLKSPDSSLSNLVKLYESGLLEPYVLFARADEGISQDYPAYREAHRDLLRRYWMEVVIEGR